MFERCLYFNSNALVRQINRIWDEAFTSENLSAPHAYLLRMVNQQPGMSQQKLAEELRLEKSTVARFVNAMIDKGLLSRKKGGDGRENLLYVSAEGKKTADRLEKIGNELYEKMKRKLGAQRFELLVQDMREALNEIR